jgi:hypothetical protein
LTGRDWRLSSVATKEVVMAVTTTKRIVVSKEVHMLRSKNVGAALIGLLVVAAISVAAGSGRKPAMGGPANVNVRQLSASEVKDILHRFPEIVPVWVTAHPNDTSHLKLQFPLKEVTSTYLERALPGVRFYQGQVIRQPPGPYMMAIAGSRRLMMPGEFNRLLLACGLKVTDENVIELAEAFVLAALGEWDLSYPQIDFLEAKKSKLKPDVLTYDAAVLKVRVGEHIEKWHFDVLRNQFDAAGSKNEEGRRKDYLPVMIDSLPGRGQLNPTTDTVIDTFFTRGDASAERDSLGTGSASGSETEEGQEVKVSLRRLPNSEVMTIFDKYPETVSGEPAHPRGSEVLASLYPLSEVTAAPLRRAFPNVRFFKGLNFDIHPPMPYVMAIAGHKRYPMPGGLNQLLVDSDVRVTDANLVEIAKAAVILALGEDMLGNPRNTGYVSDELLAFPKITSLSAEMQVTGESHAAKLTVRIGDSEESWYVHRWHDRLGWMSRGNANGFIKDYDMPEARPLRQR